MTTLLSGILISNAIVLTTPTPPPVGSAMVSGYHFDNNFIDQSGPGKFAYNTPWVVGYDSGVTFSSSGKFGTPCAFFGSGFMTLRSERLGAFTLNSGGEWQISVWLNMIIGAFGYAGGEVIDLGAVGHANGFQIGGALPLDPATGQFNLRVQSFDTVATIVFNYASFDGTNVSSTRLRSPTTGIEPTMPSDGNWHHLGIAGDVNGTRCYVDGILVGDDSDITQGRPAGQRPMWAGTNYTDQVFFMANAFAGNAGGGAYDYSKPWGVDFPAFAATYSGSIDDLVVWNGPGSATFTGPSIVVPTAPFSNPL